MPNPELFPEAKPAKKQTPLYVRMYFQEIYIDLVRFVGYEGKSLEEAKSFVHGLAAKHGRDKAMAASEEVVVIDQDSKPPIVRLTAEARKLAFQMLGPPPASSKASTITPTPSTPSRQPEPASPPPPEKKKRKKSAEASLPSAPTTTNSASTDSQSPIMQQYRAAKEKHPDMLLLFRIGDFCELFDQDAETAHKLLGLTLTTRDQTIAMAVFPHHQLETYLHKLLKEGQRVAVCEPVDESLARGPIRREVTRVVTPGTLVEDSASIDAKSQVTGETPETEARLVKQPRHFVLKQYEEWLNKAGLAFVAAEDVRRTTPAVKPYVGVLDFIVLRGEEKLLVTVRPNLQAKHLKAISELQDVFGPEYKPMRIWPAEGPDGWIWQDHPVDVSAAKAP